MREEILPTPDLVLLLHDIGLAPSNEHLPLSGGGEFAHGRRASFHLMRRVGGVHHDPVGDGEQFPRSLFLVSSSYPRVLSGRPGFSEGFVVGCRAQPCSGSGLLRPIRGAPSEEGGSSSEGGDQPGEHQLPEPIGALVFSNPVSALSDAVRRTTRSERFTVVSAHALGGWALGVCLGGGGFLLAAWAVRRPR